MIKVTSRRFQLLKSCINKTEIMKNREITSRIWGIILLIGLALILPLSLKISTARLFSAVGKLNYLGIDIAVSLGRIALSVGLAWSLSIILGYLLHKSKRLYNLCSPSLNFLRNISPFAWLPFAIIWFGLGESPIFFVMFITILFPAIISALSIYESIQQDLLDEAAVNGTHGFSLFWYIEMPLALPKLVYSFRILWGLGWGTIVAAEMLGVKSGLGFRLLDFRYLLKYENMVIYLLVMGGMGILLDWFFGKIQKNIENRIS